MCFLTALKGFTQCPSSILGGVMTSSVHMFFVMEAAKGVGGFLHWKGDPRACCVCSALWWLPFNLGGVMIRSLQQFWQGKQQKLVRGFFHWRVSLGACCICSVLCSMLTSE